jgi:DNA repair exonuclease SbcCD ATPase subunit
MNRTRGQEDAMTTTLMTRDELEQAIEDLHSQADDATAKMERARGAALVKAEARRERIEDEIAKLLTILEAMPEEAPRPAPVLVKPDVLAAERLHPTRRGLALIEVNDVMVEKARIATIPEHRIEQARHEWKVAIKEAKRGAFRTAQMYIDRAWERLDA